MMPAGSRCASFKNASHMTRLRAGVKIFRSRSLILKFSSCSLMTTAQPDSSSAFVVMSERRLMIFGRHRNGPSGSFTASMMSYGTGSRFAAEIIVGVAEQTNFKGFGIFLLKLLDVDVF